MTTEKQQAVALATTTALLRLHPVHALSLRVVSRECGLPLPLLRGLYPTWTALLLATIQQWHGRRVSAAALTAHRDGAAAFLRAIVQANLAEPALSRAVLGTVTVATTHKDPLAELMQQDWAMFHGFVQQTLAADVAAGREPDTMDPERGAEQLIALFDGLQVQAMRRPEMDLLRSFDRAVARLRAGWLTPYTAVN